MPICFVIFDLLAMNISQTGKKYNLSADTLRYYEKIVLLPCIKRTDGGYRYYSEVDCERIEIIKVMRSADMSIEDLLKYMKIVDDDKTKKDRKSILIKYRKHLVEKIAVLQTMLSKLNEKIDDM